MEKAYKYLIAGLAIGLVLAVVGTFALSPSLMGSQDNCDECHEGHGSVVAPDVNVNGTILLTGDTPQDEMIPIADIFKLKQKDVVTLKLQNDEGIPSRGVPVFDFLKAYGVNDFEQIILYADDFEVTVNKSEMTEDTVFVPHEYSIRILSSNMPVSVWLKNIKTIVVVGKGGDSISVNGKEITFGEMLNDGIDTMVTSRRTNGYIYEDQNYQFEAGYVVTGIGLKDLLFKEGYKDFSKVTIKGSSEKILLRYEVLDGSYFLTRDQGKIKLATADKNRPLWQSVESITVE
ncbi:hypothetical protein CUJ83_03370 [Methanocella sp. CWC-04]|uniref:Uncharacterized protein n=1 Tax=Methanooceanicella nereidis TaxID=2052831 RepID=A0AAP2RAQ4_9EURY|nr:hypothetical protein [Methanocella sp. CWC-04]MCD1294034.1 hypothetical protein [Methanocella sp. CWC-04]